MFRIPVVLIGFLFGSIPFAALITRAFTHGDIRKMGSGNPGTTNVIRAVGFLPGALTFLCDCAKAAAAVLIARALFLTQPVALWAGVGTVLGHDFSPFLKLKGGKGVAVTIAMAALIDYRLLIALIPAAAAAAVTARMAVGSVAFACVLPFAAAVFGLKTEAVAVLSFLGLLMLVRHRSNFYCSERNNIE